MSRADRRQLAGFLAELDELDPLAAAQNEEMIDEAELRQMSQDERRRLAHALAVLDAPHPLTDPRLRRRMRFGLLLMTGCCIALAGWIAILILTLPGHFTSRDWQTVWVGLDLAELAGFAATAWAAWHQRQVVTFFMIITGTLLVCDAWFDVALSYGSSDFTTSIVSALLVELPLAFLLFASARRLVRATIQTVMELSGVAGQAPPPVARATVRGRARGVFARRAQAAGRGCHSRRRLLVFRGQTIPRGEPWTRATTPSTAR